MASQKLRLQQGFHTVRLVSAALSLMVWGGLVAGPAMAADDESPVPKIPRSLNGALEQLDLRAKPADPPPEFVTRTRPGPARLHFMPTAVPHAVSPVPVKTAAQIQAAKDALDAARARQLKPALTPVDLTRAAPLQPVPPKLAKEKVEKAKPAADAD